MSTTFQESDATVAQRAEVYGMSGAAGVDAAARIRAQSARIAELEAQLVTTQRDLIDARQHEKAIRLSERTRTTEAINAAMLNGASGTNAPDHDLHWLADWWKLGHKNAQRESHLRRADEHRRRLANEFDTVLEDLRPAIEHILANRDEFGAKIGDRMAPIVSDYFLKAYATAPRVVRNPHAPGGAELVHFTVTATKHLSHGTRIDVSTNEEARGYVIEITNEALPNGKQKISVLQETFGEILAIIAELTGLTLPGGVKIELDGKTLVLRAPEVLMVGSVEVE
jgi:hypothetical protein